MPVYDYRCREHGVFHELGTVSESADPSACPACGIAAPRVIMLPPEVLAMDPARRAALTRNEASRHQPLLSTPDQRQDAQRRRAAVTHVHGRGCGCDDRPVGGSSLWYTADGKKSFPSMRPWMISH